jgi:monoterpene epsilon-lactone hydrolase
MVLLVGRSVPAELPRIDENTGEIHVPAFDFPESSFLSADTKSELKLRRTNQHRQACPSLEEATAAEAPAIRKCQAEAYYETESYQRLRKLYDVELKPQEMGGVDTEVFTPTQGILRRNRKRVLINVHGGNFYGGSRTISHMESIPIASIGRIKVVSVDYRMAPEHAFPAASEDVAAVYRALLKDYAPKNIGIYGCSAGGTLAAEAVAWFVEKKLPVPGAVGMFGGTGRLALINNGDSAGLAYKVYKTSSVAPDEIRLPPNSYFRGADLANPLVSPIDSPSMRSKYPPSLLLSGSRSFEASALMDANNRLALSGVNSRLHLWDGLGHCFYLEPGLPESRQAQTIIFQFFDKNLGTN